jgi:MoaA/NifB/PqqE/SkfB family radical SAM enzyme
MKINPGLLKQFIRIAPRAVREHRSPSGRPFLMLHFVTNRCMCDCKSCLWKKNEQPDLPLDQIKKFHIEAAEQGILGAAITGGEAFLRDDLGELVRFAKKEARLAILLFSTGWYLEERMDDVLPWVDMLLLSLDGSTAERHDRIRGLDGLFDKMMAGADLVRKKYPRLPVHFNACVQKGMADDIDGLIRIAEDKRIKISFDVITEYRHGEGDSRHVETGMGMEEAELRGVCEYLLQKKREGAPIINSEMYFDYFVKGRPGYRCHFPKAIMQVDGLGNIEDCLNLDKPLGNFTKTPFREILENPRFKQMQAEAEDCCSCNSPTMVDMSNIWENPRLLIERGGLSAG